jgi:hypothetical protein
LSFYNPYSVMAKERFALVLGSAIAISMALPATAWSHGGGLDASGYHHNRKAGDYHCHRGAVSPLPTGAGDAPASRQPALYNAAAQVTRPFANCAEARAAGAAPVRRGEPGYGPHLDRDNDGIGCEPYRR